MKDGQAERCECARGYTGAQCEWVDEAEACAGQGVPGRVQNCTAAARPNCTVAVDVTCRQGGTVRYWAHCRLDG